MRAIILALLLAGCAMPAWYKDGTTERDFNMDNGQCKAQALATPQLAARIHAACMEGKGWTLH